MTYVWKFLAHLCRIITGLVFVFSGVAKGIDPIGGQTKLNDYLHAFGFSFSDGITLGLAMLLNLSEFIIGVALLTNSFMRVTSVFLLVFMFFFTSLTLYSALANPVSDCGCFGDAIKLTNWQTFFKNVFLLIPSLLLFYLRSTIAKSGARISEWTTIVTGSAIFVAFMWYNYSHLPIIDFRPYKVGTNIAEGMKIPEGMPQDEYDTRLFYEKDGIVKEYTLETYPWQDSTWKWVKTESVLVKKGYEPPIHDFSVILPDSTDITQQVLSDTSYTILFISYNLDKANKLALVKAGEFARYLSSHTQVKFYGLTSSPRNVIEQVQANFRIDFPFCQADETMLKTVIRSNPGYVLIHNGVVQAMWHYKALPRSNQFKGGLDSMLLNHYRTQSETLMLCVSVLIGLLVIVSSNQVIVKLIQKIRSFVSIRNK